MVPISPYLDPPILPLSTPPPLPHFSPLKVSGTGPLHLLGSFDIEKPLYTQDNIAVIRFSGDILKHFLLQNSKWAIRVILSERCSSSQASQVKDIHLESSFGVGVRSEVIYLCMWRFCEVSVIGIVTTLPTFCTSLPVITPLPPPCCFKLTESMVHYQKCFMLED